MKITAKTTAPSATKADLLVLGVFSNDWSRDFAPQKKGKKTGKGKQAPSAKMPADSEVATLNTALEGILITAAQQEGFEATRSQVFTLHTHNRVAASQVTLVGLGERDGALADHFRTLGGHAVREAKRRHAKRVAIWVPDHDSHTTEVLYRATTEGAILANYRFSRYVEDDADKAIQSLELLCERLGGTKAAIIRGQAIAAGVSLARDLVNECPAALTPIQFASEARKVGRSSGLTVTVLDEKALAKENMGMMLAVARAATPYTPPRLVKLVYTPKGGSKGTKKKAQKHICLVGKGLTFDSGGLDIKPAAGMLEMKIDMGGAAAVLGAMSAIGKLCPDAKVTAYLGCAENGIGGNAYHPGDVLTSRKGLTVEVNNTDAEGRLVLADCIDYALTKDKPDVLIDLATLTGACMVALGPSTAGLFSDDDNLAADIRNAGIRSGEDFWRLPLNPALMGQLKSNVADCRNTGERMGGAITAGLFLKQFVDGRAAWAHLDIAGPATNDKEDGYNVRGGAGFGVRTLVGFIEGL